jgi:hypothetical protein
MNSDIHTTTDILILQEPYFDSFQNTKASPHWHVLKPTDHKKLGEPITAITMINKRLSTGQWMQLDIPNTQDLVGLQLSGPFGTVSILNIYNNQHHDHTLQISDSIIHDIINDPSVDEATHDNYIIWAGDFNRHHPMWDEERNVQLFSAKNIDEAQVLIDIVSAHGLEMALPQGIPTYFVNRNGNWTRPDNVFCSSNAIDVLTRCTTVPEDSRNGRQNLIISPSTFTSRSLSQSINQLSP